ncbi:MAG: 2-oxoglutarate dehydrogenase E1 component [Rickettsiaceae bacterium]
MKKDFEKTDFLYGSNSVFIEELYQQYLHDPSSIDSSWLSFFQQYNAVTPLKSTAKIIATNNNKTEPRQTLPQNEIRALNSLKAKFMINAYRQYGHYLAKLDPLNIEVNKTHSELHLNIADFGFQPNDLAETIDVKGEFGNIQACSVAELRSMLETTYAGTIAVEFAHLEDADEQQWLYSAFENTGSHLAISNDDKKKLLDDLVEVEGFEQYLHTKFPGAKRFSIEGGDAAIICLDKVIEDAAIHHTQEAVLGLAHRGRLSTLTKVMHKPYRAILSEFSGGQAFPNDIEASGDVKYHMGFSSDRIAHNKQKIHLSLTPNPSHLEAVNPVVAGKVRAKQCLLGNDSHKVIGILVHGDAAFCGQGVVAESLMMSGLRPYNVGGIFHLVINNQIGFTANASDGRMGRYCTDIAKAIGAPIIHVNGDDIESVLMATKIACEYRRKFAKDVIVDIVCYRKYGHNEGDEPMYTQALMYNVIKAKQTPAAIYADHLQKQSIISQDYYNESKQKFKLFLDQEFKQAKSYKPSAQWLEGNWLGVELYNNSQVITGVAKEKLKTLTSTLCTIPKSFVVNRKLEKLFAARLEHTNNDQPIDWATAEQLAFATLLQQHIPIRITGQDAGRGTFSHRHAVLHSQVDNTVYEPLNNIATKQGYFEIADSNLSEYAALGFEYGYSLVNPKHLVIWEAQFGDFCNGAQIVFDQFIASAETKWLRMSGLVCLLPNAMEGQGPEHSSARLERFLQLCAENNMQVVYPTTPASIFHLLRRQVLSNFRKPLIVMSPKSLLRHKLAVSCLSELDEGTSFLPIIDEIDHNITAKQVKKIIFCTGKVYYDLLGKRRENNINNIAIIRVEQLYPLDEDMIIKIMLKHSQVMEVIWCQEEPKNMGAWIFIQSYMQAALNKANIKHNIKFVGRHESASPAVGYLTLHNQQQESLVNRALNISN